MNSSLNNCLDRQVFTSSGEFFNCYVTLASLNWPSSISQYVFVILTIVLNSTLVILLVRKPSKTSVFDHVLIAHCLINIFVGLLILPFYHFFYLFTYWPFGEFSSLFWTAFDSSKNSITNLTVLYITWIRFRSVKAPSSFEREFICRWSIPFCVSIWLLVFGVYIPITFGYGIVRFKSPYGEFFLVFFTWLLPMIGIKFLHIYIQVILKNRVKRVRNSIVVLATDTNQSFSRASFLRVSTRQMLKRMLHLGPMMRFQLIITFFWFQWIGPCLIALINPFCNCVSSRDSSSIYWLTYIVCLTDPILILLLNPNVTFNSTQRSRRSIK